MVSSSAVIRTDLASRYLQQLCKHFAHKIPVAFTADAGECSFVCGVARLRAGSGALNIEIEAPDEAQREQTQGLIESHLLRFAFREELAPLTWKEAGA